MIRVRTQEGQVISAKDTRSVVRALRAASRSPGDSMHDYMREVATRIAIQTGKTIDTTTPKRWVRGLIAAGFIEEVVDATD